MYLLLVCVCVHAYVCFRMRVCVLSGSVGLDMCMCGVITQQVIVLGDDRDRRKHILPHELACLVVVLFVFLFLAFVCAWWLCCLFFFFLRSCVSGGCVVCLLVLAKFVCALCVHVCAACVQCVCSVCAVCVCVRA